jgi:hypothetical protein
LTGPGQNQATHKKARFQKNLAFFRFSGIPYLPFTTSQLPLLMNGLPLLLRITPIDEKNSIGFAVDGFVSHGKRHWL